MVPTWNGSLVREIESERPPEILEAETSTRSQGRRPRFERARRVSKVASYPNPDRWLISAQVVTGEAQILRFRSRKTAAGRGDRMHVHVDKPGTRWVAVASLGDTARFVVDDAARCARCWTGGGAGTAGTHWRDWHKVGCATCTDVDLASGDVLLFFGDPAARVAHGNLGTAAKTAPPGLPRWCYGGRVSCQYRLSAGFLDRSGMLY